jgi:hypothetical protein
MNGGIGLFGMGHIVDEVGNELVSAKLVCELMTYTVEEALTDARRRPKATMALAMP